MTTAWYAYGLEAMEDFLAYNEEDTSHDDVKIMEQILHTAGKYLPEEEIRKIQKAYIFAAQAHNGQKRLSGEDYIVHPLRATQILMTLKPYSITIQTCILHDVIEDTPVSYQDIEAEFGKEVADLCEGLVKVSKVRYHGQERHIETLKKTFLAMASDLRVIFVKIADRIHNIQTLHFHPQEDKKKRIAEETLKIYVPICKRLGLYQFQLYLENGVFKILHFEEYGQVMQFLKKTYPHADRDIIKGKIKLEKALLSKGLQDFTITGRVKSPYRIYEKLINKYHNLDFSKVFDVMAFRIVVDSIPECYNVLGIIHSAYNPLINKIKDYIAVPKFNDYQSLHTTILGLYPFPVEIQIRTKDMNAIAEFGVAAHFLYKEGNNHSVLTQRQSQRMQELQESVHKYQTEEKKESFKDKLAIELLDNTIFVYTPKGDVIELTKGSTVLDFAFRVHSDVGLKFKNATVNGIIKPISQVLSSGDVVSINIHKNKYSATRYWMDYLHTSTAKSKLSRFLRQQEKEVYVKKGIEVLDLKLEKYGLPSLTNDKDKVKKYYGDQFEHQMMQIASKSLTPLHVLKDVYDLGNKGPKIQKPTERVVPQTHEGVVIDDSQLFEYELCPECQPKKGDKIIARSGKDGLKIHNLHCRALQTVALDKLIKAHWLDQEPQLYHFDIKLSVHNSYVNLIVLLSTLQDLGIAIDAVNIQRPQEGSYVIHIQFSHQNPSKIAYVIHYIQKNYGSTISIKKKIS